MLAYNRSFLIKTILALATWITSLYLYWQLTSSYDKAGIAVKTYKVQFEEVSSPKRIHKSWKSEETFLQYNSINQNSEKKTILNKKNIFGFKIKNSDGKDSGGSNEIDGNFGLIKSDADRRLRDEGYKIYAFNILASQRIKFNRVIPDTRNELCNNVVYPEKLPSVSIIICFYNEHFHTLIRSVNSILDRTPRHLLQEIVLVDDYSDIKYLYENVSNYISTLKNDFHGNSIDNAIYDPIPIKLLKTDRREGLIRARIFGAENAEAEVIVFLDSHIEVNVKWLEPLLHRLSEDDHNRVVIPIIDVINADTFEYTSSPLVRGGFNWGLHFKWDNIPKDVLQTKDDFIKPMKTPTMAGGLFAMYKSYFNSMGKYDPGMDTWGGENIEMSFRIWMCGGELEIIPCSRVGHVFRKRRPYGSTDGTDSMLHNSLRLAHVWMDGYVDNYLKRVPAASNLNFGDITDRILLRKSLNCKSFRWYLDNVYPQLILDTDSASKVNEKLNSMSDPFRNKFQPWHARKRNYTDSYQLRLSGSNFCVQSIKDIKSKGSGLILAICLRTPNQMWYETIRHELVLGKMLCLEASSGGNGKVLLSKCHEMAGTQEWRHKSKNGSPIYNSAAGTCLGVNEKLNGSPVVMQICSSTNLNSWDFIKSI